LPRGRAIMPRSASACMSSWKKCSKTASNPDGHQDRTRLKEQNAA
jgi:hypothetical protein